MDFSKIIKTHLYREQEVTPEFMFGEHLRKKDDTQPLSEPESEQISAFRRKIAKHLSDFLDENRHLPYRDLKKASYDWAEVVVDCWESRVQNNAGNLKWKETNDYLLPNKIDLYEGLDVTAKDKVFISFRGDIRTVTICPLALFVNGENRVVGVFTVKRFFENGELKFALTADAEWIDFVKHDSSRYYFGICAFSPESYRFEVFKVPLEVNYQQTETAAAHLCIDFGTSNSTVGCFLDEDYVGNVSNIAIINGNVRINEANVAAFEEYEKRPDLSLTLDYRKMAPTIVYVDNCRDADNILYSFGYEAARRIKKDNYCPQGSCFMEIKRWTSNIDEDEEIRDRFGNKAVVSRKEIISRYLMFVIRNAENQFKCRFKHIHISAPVKLKKKALNIYADILKKNGYELEQQYAIDEGVAVLYSIINNQIRDNAYENNKEERALIIDCGGGTSDLASCRYKIAKDEDGIINLDVTTEYMNGDVNFGGNNLTYRIMQFMKIVYARWNTDKSRVNIDCLITQDINSMFSYIEGEIENDDLTVKARYDDLYGRLEAEYKQAENIIPTRYMEYESKPREIYDKVKNNFYFLWKLAEEMKEEFYRTTSISRYQFNDSSVDNKDIDLHVNRIENWRLSVAEYSNGSLSDMEYPDITFTAKEIDKLIRADIYYLVRKFLNDLYYSNTLDSYSQIKLSGQSSKINIFMDALKEFLPGKKIKSGRIHSKGNDSEELKLLCLNGAIMYLHALDKSNIEITLKNDTKPIPISVYVKNENDEDKEMIRQGSDWNQPASRRRITSAGKKLYLHMRNADREIGEPYKYVYENADYKATSFEHLNKISGGRIRQDIIDSLTPDKKYIFVFLNKEDWGFNVMPVYAESGGKLFAGKAEFCSFEMDILQNTFFDGRK